MYPFAVSKDWCGLCLAALELDQYSYDHSATLAMTGGSHLAVHSGLSHSLWAHHDARSCDSPCCSLCAALTLRSHFDFVP